MKNHLGLSARAPLPHKPWWRHILGWPRTRPGWWSVGLMAGFFAFFGLFQLLVASGQRGGATFLSNPWLALAILTAASSAIAGGVAAMVAIIWRHERSFLSFLALLLGLLVALFALGEILFPH